MNRNIYTLLFLLPALSIYGQNHTTRFIRSSEIQTPLKGVVDLMNTGTSFYPSLQTVEIEDKNEAGRDTGTWVKSDQEPSFFVEDRQAGAGYKTEAVEPPEWFLEFNGF